MAEKKKKRFVEKAVQGFYSIIVDTKTGVNYFRTPNGITPLLDSEGKVIVSSREEMKISRKETLNTGFWDNLQSIFR